MDTSCTAVPVKSAASTSDRFLRLPDVMNIVGLSRSQIYALVSKGTFPKQVSLGARAAGWIESEISQWVNERIEDSRKEASNG